MSTQGEKYIDCPLCQKRFLVRSLSKHMDYCEKEQELSRKKQRLCIPFLDSMKKKTTSFSSNLHQPSESKQGINNESPMIELLVEKSPSHHTDLIDSDAHILASISSTKTSFENHAKEHSITDKYDLIKQEKLYQERMKNAHYLWSSEDLAKLELLKLMQKHNCPNSMYEEMIGWASFYSKQSLNCSLFKNSKVQGRDSFLNDIQFRRDMKNMKPLVHNVKLFRGCQNGVIADQTIQVSTFDFKQQLLSLLRDPDLMNPANLVLHEPMKEFDQSSNTHDSSDTIAEIQDSDWYKCAYDHYNKKIGKDSNRVICGIIITIDKTHTDWKGKLCLEPVQFTLSIFNTKTRKTKASAWKCLGFINDLDTYKNSKVFTEKEKRSEDLDEDDVVWIALMLILILNIFRHVFLFYFFILG